MKKIKLIMPLIGLSTVAATMMGMASCTKTTSYNLSVPFMYVVEGQQHSALRTQQPIATSKKTIDIEIDTSMLQKGNDMYPDEASFRIANTFEESESIEDINLIDAVIYAGKNKLEKAQSTSFTGPYQYRFVPEQEPNRIQFSQGTLEGWPKLTMHLTVNEKIDKYYPIFWLSQENNFHWK